MSEAMSAAGQLCLLLERENAALSAFDLRGAAALVADKQAAANRLTALAQSRQAVEPAAATRLRELTGQNRRLLQRAIAVQGQVIALIAGALPRQAGLPRYAASGTPARTAAPVPFTLSARA